MGPAGDLTSLTLWHITNVPSVSHIARVYLTVGSHNKGPEKRKTKQIHSFVKATDNHLKNVETHLLNTSLHREQAWKGFAPGSCFFAHQ